MEFKVNRKIKFENLNSTIAKKKIKQIDKERAEYYKHFTNQTWGDRNNYDLCIDSSIGVEKTTQIICDFIKNKRQK